MAKQAKPASYPQFWHDPRTNVYLRYNSAVWVSTASEGQLQVQQLDPKHPRLLHSERAVPSTEADFLAAYEATWQRLRAVAQAPAEAATRFERKRERPDAWYYREQGRDHMRLNLSEDEGRWSVNLILEDFGLGYGLDALPRPPQRVPSDAVEFAAAFKQAASLLGIGASGGWYRALFAGPSAYLGPQQGQTYTIQVRTPGMLYPYVVLIQELPGSSTEYIAQSAIRQEWKEPQEEGGVANG